LCGAVLGEAAQGQKDKDVFHVMDGLRPQNYLYWSYGAF
jgi:hypothetical protein